MRYSKKMLIIMLICCVVLTYFRAHTFLENKSKKEQDLASLYAERIQNVVHDIVDDGRALQEMFRLFNGKLSEERFEEVARIVFKSRYYKFISYQPDGIVQYTYPREAFEWTLGMDILEEEATRIDATYAKNSGRTILTGPYYTGKYEAIVARRPVFEFVEEKRAFWGFISLGFDVKGLLRDVVEINALTNFNYEYGIFTIHKGKYIEIMQSENFEKREDSKRVFTVGDQTWSFYLYDDGKMKELLNVIISYMFMYSILATMVYFVVKTFEHKNINARKMSYIDPLTKAYNRKMIDEYLEQHPQTKDGGFTVFYLDLNDFKPVNDVYGHEMGDKLLIAFVERMRHNFKADTIVARMGGDEFVLILHEKVDLLALKGIIQRIEKLSQRKFYLDGVDISISSSIGYGQYPQDGRSMEEILSKADERMYEWKRRLKASRAAVKSEAEQGA